MINRLLQRTGGRPVDFAEMATVLRDAIECNVYIASREGKIFGYSLQDDFECNVMEEKVVNEGELPGDYNKELLKIRETRANLEKKTEFVYFLMMTACSMIN